MSATDELEAMAESIGLAMPQAATLMMEAADTISELRNRCNNLVDERERLFRANVEKNGKILWLVKENAKLRELVKDIHTLATDYGVYVQYPYCDTWDEKLAVAEKQMRELGVEVE